MEFLKSYKEHLDAYLLEHAFEHDPTNLYKPVDYILSLGGKRIRPLMLLMAADAAGGSLSDAMPGAMCLELFHNFTLLHDDIMDDAPLRRGQSTVHEKYDVNTAILSGDVMLILAYEYLSKTKTSDIGSLYQVFNKMAREVCEGQQMDMDFESRDDVTIAEYIEMIRLKTSVLIGAAMQMGAHIAEAGVNTQNHLYKFGESIGIAFQIQDDILDTYGSPKVGKQKCGDIIQNKKTYLYLKALELSSNEERQRLLDLYGTSPGDPAEKIASVLTIYKSANAKGYAEEVKLAYRDLANSHLDAAGLNDTASARFKEFGDFLLSRSH